MKFSTHIAVIIISVTFLPLLGQDQEPKPSPLTRLMNQTRKDKFSIDVKDRRRASETYLRFSKEVSDVVTVLTLSLADSDDEVRISAAVALAAIGQSARRATKELIKVLETDQVPDARICAANALGAIYHDVPIGRDNAIVVMAIRKAMRTDKDLIVRHRACYALRMIGADARASADDLLGIIQDTKEDPILRDLACDSFGFVVDSECKHLVPRLLDCYGNEKENLRLKGLVLISLGKIGDKENVIIPIMIDALAAKAESEIHLRGGAVTAIAYLGPKAKQAVPALIAALDVSKFSDKNTANAFQVGVLDALCKIGPDARAAIPAISEIAQSKAKSRFSAQKALKCIQIKSKN